MTYIYISDVVEIVDRFYEEVKKETRPTVENKVPAFEDLYVLTKHQYFYCE